VNLCGWLSDWATVDVDRTSDLGAPLPAPLTRLTPEAARSGISAVPCEEGSGLLSEDLPGGGGVIISCAPHEQTSVPPITESGTVCSVPHSEHLRTATGTTLSPRVSGTHRLGIQ